MSRLIDKLNRVTKVAPQPMGFRTAQVTPSKPQMLLIASLSNTEKIDSLSEYVDGADAVLFNFGKMKEIKVLQKLTQSLTDIPWGGWLGETDGKRLAAMIEAGSDFVVFPASSGLSALYKNDKVGKILQGETSLTEGLLKTVNGLPVDAVLAADEADGSLTWRHIMLFQRFADLLAKPLLVYLPANAADDELQAIWEVGVDGVVVEASTQTAGKVKELRQIIDGLPAVPRRRVKTEVLVPRISAGAAPEIEEEEEEEE